MTLKGCMLCFKHFSFVINFLIWLSGLFLLCSAIYIRMDPTINHMVTIGYSPFLSNFHFACYFLICLGATVNFIGFFGCCSAYQESPSMFAAFLGVLVLALAGEMGAGGWIFMQKSHLDHRVEESFGNYIATKFGQDIYGNEPIDFIQINYKCCGGKGPSDYFEFSFNNTTTLTSHTDHPKHIHHHYQARRFSLPTSCCGYYETKIKSTVHCHSNKTTTTSSSNNNKPIKTHLLAYQQGCSNHISKTMFWFIEKLSILALFLLSLEVLSLVVSIVVCCALKRQSAGGYKS